MQGIYRRMSLSAPRSHKQLKKLWCEYVHGKSSEPEADSLVAKLLVQFLDASLSIPELTQTSVVDDFIDDMVDIVSNLLVCVQCYSIKETSAPNNEERCAATEVVFKSLCVIELFLTCKDPKVQIKDLITSENPWISLVVSALQAAHGVLHLMALLRILRCVVITDNHVIELIRLNGFEALSTLAERERQPALTSQVLAVFKAYSEHHLISGAVSSHASADVNGSQASPTKGDNRLRNYSISSTGSGTHRTTVSGLNAHHMHHHSAAYNASWSAAVAAAAEEVEEDQQSMAAKGFNLAVNVVSELLKFTPLTSSWLYSEGDALKLKDLSGPSGLSLGDEIARLTAVPQTLSSLTKEAARTERLMSSANKTKLDNLSLTYSKSVHKLSLSLDTSRIGLEASPVAEPRGGSVASSSSSSSQAAIREFPRGRQPSQCALSEGDDSGDDIDAPQDTHIRDQMRRQGMTALVLMSLSQASGPSEVLEALSTLETLLLRNAAAQREFLAVGGYGKVIDMFLRVEDNLALLVPCRDMSLAAASGSQNNRSGLSLLQPQHSHTQSASPSMQQQPPHDSSPESKGSLYHSQAASAGDFDGYYSSLLMVVLNLVLDESTCSPLAHISNKPMLPKKGLVVGNSGALSLIVSLLHSAQYSFVSVAVKLVYALMQSSPMNVVILEASGVVAALIEVLVVIIFTAGVDQACLHCDKAESPAIYSCRTAETLESAPTTSCEAPSHSINRNLMAIAADIVLVLQAVAVATSLRDSSVLAVFTAIAVAASLPASDMSEDNPGQHTVVRCHNCEVEAACLECLHDSCICDRFFRLCHECDKVFHKSALKRSHIRLPVVHRSCANPRVVLSVDGGEQTAEAVAQKVGSLVKDGLSIDVCQSLLFGAMNGYSRAALAACGLTASHSPLLNCGDGDCELGEFLSYKERAVSVLMIGVRGLLDDRKARGQSLPYEVFPSLLLCMRRLVIDPFQIWTAQDSVALVNSGDGSAFSDLMDHRDDLLTPHSEIINKHNKHGDQFQQPPELCHNSPRRIRLSLLVQTMARFVVSDSLQGRLVGSAQDNPLVPSDSPLGPAMTGKKMLACIDLLKSFGLDALFTHLLVDSSASFTHLTTVDKQYVIWLVRECVVSASRLKPDRATRFLEWYLWLLRSDVVTPLGAKYTGSRPDNRAVGASRLSLAISAAVKGAAGGIVAHHNSYSEHSLAAIPSANPKIPVLVRLLVLQELRLLMAGDDVPTNRKSDLFAQVLPTASNLWVIPFATTVTDSYSSRSTSLDLDERPSGYSHQSARSVAGGGYNQMKTLNMYAANCNVPMRSGSIKVVLAQLGFVEVLSELVMGDMCSRQVLELLDPASKPFFGKNNINSTSTASGSTSQLSDLDKEDWWAALATFGQLLTCCDAAKDILDRYLGLQKVVRFLLPLMQFASANMAHSHDHGVNYAAVLVGLFFELSVSSGRFSAPTKPFAMALPRFPVQQLYQAKVSARDLRGASPRLQRKSFGKSDSPAFDSSMAVVGLGLLFSRPCICNLRPCTDSTGDNSDASYTLSPTQGVAGTTALCPVYFTHERTVALVASTVRSFPLTLTSEVLRSGFTSGRSSTGSGTLFPASIHQRSRSDTYTKAPVGSFSGRPPSMCSQLSTDLLESAAHHPGSAGISLSRKMMLKNMSSASIQSLESDVHRWELDSVGRGSTHGGDLTGRASFHSHQSLVTLAHALKSGGQTVASSVNNDGASVLGNYLKSLKTMDDGEDQVDGRRPPGSAVPLSGVSVDISPRSAKGHLSQLPEVDDLYPFPATLGPLESSTPLVYFPLLRTLDSGLSYYASNVLLLLHHALLIRSGMPEDGREDLCWQDGGSVHDGSVQEAPSAVKLDHTTLYRQVLRKHLAMLLPPSYHYPSWHTDCDVWQPPVSQLQIRSVECGELLLAVAMVSPHDVQTFVLSSLSDLLDGNPTNAFLFAHSPTTCVSLTRLIPSLQEGLREAVGYIVSQILRYSVQVNALHELISTVSRDASAAMVLARSASSTAELFEAIHEEDCDAAFNRNILFVMGRTAERVCPSSFLNFDCGSPFESRVEMPSIPSLPIGGLNLSVCAWIRMGAMRGAASSSLLQMSCKQSDLLVDLYFRVVHKLVPVVTAVGGKSFAHLAEEQEESSKKTIQLCISFGKSVHSQIVQHETHDHRSGASSAKSGVGDMRDMSSAAIAQARADRMRHDAEYAAGQHSSHWDLAVDQLMGLGENHAGGFEPESGPVRTGSALALVSSDDITDRTVRQSLSTLSSAIARHSVPDAIVEFDWSELGDWHLLAVSLTTTSVTCSVDGRRVPVLHWTPLGYQYDEGSSALRKSRASALHVPLADGSKPFIAVPSLSSILIPQPVSLLFDPRATATKEDPLRVSLGGLLYEAKAFDLVDKHVYSSMNQAFYHTSSAHSWLLESSAQRASALLLAFSSLLSGFSGSVGELAVLDGPVDETQLRNCLREGPVHGLREIKATRLSSLSAASMPVAAATQLVAPKAMDAKTAPPLLQFPLMRPSSPVTGGAGTTDSGTAETRLNIFSSQTYPVAVVSDPFAKSRPRDKDSASHSTYSDSVQIHHTNAMQDAVTALGGLRVLFPLMISDKARLIAALRVMGCIVTASTEAYSDFKAQHVDKAVLYCCKSYSRLVTLETAQVLFELVSFSDGSGSFGTAVRSSSDTERILRTSVLELLVDVVASSCTEMQLARSAVDWLREICDDQAENSQTYLKTVGLLPLLVILSVWGLGEACLFPTAAQPKIMAVVVEPKVVQPRVRLHERSESVVASPSYKPVELSRKPSAGDVPHLQAGGEDVQREGWTASSSTAQQVSTTEKFKLQLACFRLLKLLVSGTTGDLTQRASLSQSQTVTGFSAANLATLLNFAVSSACRAHQESSSKSRGRGRDRRHEHLRYSSQYVGMPLLSQMEFGSSDYWLFAGAVAALDAVLVLVNGPLECTVINMLRGAYPGSSLWHVILGLMGSSCVEVRQRAITLLILSFSSSDGKMDARQVALFERMHGFQSMAELLAGQDNACTDSVLDALFSLVFWSHHGHKGKGGGGDLSSESAGGAQFKGESTHIRSDSRVVDGEGRERASSLDGVKRDPSAANGGMMSMFTWSNSTQGATSSKPIPAPSIELSVAIPESAASSSSPDSAKSLPIQAEYSVAPGVTLYVVDTSSGPLLGEKRLSSPRDSLLLFVGEQRDAAGQQTRGSPVASNHSHKSLSNLSIDEGELLLETQAEPAVHTRPSLNESSSVERAVPFEAIQIPQAIEVLVRVLQVAKSVEQVTASFARLENCVTLSSAVQHNVVRGRVERKDSTAASTSSSANKADAEAVSRNAEAIFAQKDWLLWLCDSLLIYRRRMLNGEDLEAISSSVFSLSESESVGGNGGGDFDQSEAESDTDGGSVGGDSMSEDSSSVNNSLSGGGGRQRANSKSQAWQQHMITQFTCPVFNFVRRLLTLDLKAKYASVRRWNEVLRLSLPETYDVQEAILLDLVETLHSLSVPTEGVETTVQYLRNMGALLEAVLEKADMSLMFAMKVVQALHSLSYQCPPEVRGRIKETCLPEMRRSYVVRCLLDHSQSLHTRAVALSEISSPLQGYLSGGESKTLTDFQVVVLVLGMFGEAHDELSFLSATAATSGVHSASSSEKIKFARELMCLVIGLVQSCVQSSPDCRKCVQRVLLELPGDPSRAVTKAFMNMFEGSSVESRQTSSLPATSANNTTTQRTESIASNTSSVLVAPSYSWWGSWGSTVTEPAVSATVAEAKDDHLVDLEAGGGASQNEQAVSSPAEEQSESSSSRRTACRDVPSFVMWLYSAEQSDLQRELQLRIQKEFKPVQRQLDKMRERSSQRYTRHSRALQEKRAKDKTVSIKSCREALAAAKASEDRAVSVFQKDIKAWNTRLVERVELGRAVFLGTHTLPLATDGLKSPPKETRGSASRATSLRTNSFSGVVVSDALKGFLSEGSVAVEGVSRKGLSGEEALSALMTYFRGSSAAAVGSEV